MSSPVNGAADQYQMNEQEFAQELQDSLLVLSTSSPDKRDLYRRLISQLGMDTNYHAGLRVLFTDSGALGLPPRKTPEKTGVYAENLDEKAKQQLATLSDPAVEKDIRERKLLPQKRNDMDTGHNEFDPKTINILGMTEDSGMELVFKDKATERQFIDIIIRELKPKLRAQDGWLLEKLHETGFPGPNFKPLQERLDGGFDEMMRLIYKAAEELQLKELRFTQTVNVSFVSPRLGKYFVLPPVKGEGRLLNREEYDARMLATPNGHAVNINFVQVFDGQNYDEKKPVDVMIKEGLLEKSSQELPMQFPRRDIVEHLQGLVGKRRSSYTERKRQVRVAYVDPHALEGKTNGIRAETFGIRDLMTTGISSRKEMLRHADAKSFKDADVIVVVPQKHKPQDNHLYSDPNLALLLSLVVTAETDPESMRVPLVLDNRSGLFDHALALLSDATATGRFPVLQEPFDVAYNDKQLKRILEKLKDMKQREPLVVPPRHEESAPETVLQKVPNDGTFTVFIGGGHANNSKRDIEDAIALGYHCAANGWRIVTGGGSLEGSMGAVHTGFIQFHLDKLQAASGHEELKAEFKKYKKADGCYDAEQVIEHCYDALEKMAQDGLIPRKMFYAYSMDPLLKMESPSGKQPPGVEYAEAGNRVRRLEALLAPGTKIFMRGGIGTDEEFEETVRQHVEARRRKMGGNGRRPVANDIAFADGTPDTDGTMIVYNKAHALDKLLSHYGLLGEDPVTLAKRETYRIKVVTEMSQLRDAATCVANGWVNKRIRNGASVPERQMVM